ncbi:MAG: EipB family protein [Alphaproteobacteria bacterium]
MPRVFCGALLGVFAWVPGAAGAGLASHQALYELTLKSLRPNSNIVGAQGAMSVEWSRSCDGWTVNQRLRITLDLQSGPTQDTDVNFSSFESDDGLTYSFTTRTTSNGRVVDEYRGAVERVAAGEAAVARYSIPEDREVALPPGTVFPMAHTREVLDAAARGERTIWRRFFDGPRPDESPFGANVLITGGPGTGDEGPGAGLAPLMDSRWWPVRIAFFPGGGQASEPDFEVEAKVQDNGVVREFVFDYGDFAMLATLSQIEALAEPVCGGGG